MRGNIPRLNPLNLQALVELTLRAQKIAVAGVFKLRGTKQMGLGLRALKGLGSFGRGDGVHMCIHIYYM